MCAIRLVSPAEAAFMAGVTEQEISRLFADGVLVPSLINDGSMERLAPLVAPLTSFCLATCGDLTPWAQARVVRTLIERVEARQDFELFLGLHQQLGSTDFDWTVTWSCITADIWPFVVASLERATQMAQARSVIHSDPQVMGGMPCFSGTRLPVANLLALKKGGLGFPALKAAYPFLTEELVKAAEVYTIVSAKLGQVATLELVNTEGKLIRRKVVRTKGGELGD